MLKIREKGTYLPVNLGYRNCSLLIIIDSAREFVSHSFGQVHILKAMKGTCACSDKSYASLLAHECECDTCVENTDKCVASISVLINYNIDDDGVLSAWRWIA